MEKINCSFCKNLVVDLFSGVHSCSVLKCGCHKTESDFLVPIGKPMPRLVPELGEKACPGMDKFTVNTVD